MPDNTDHKPASGEELLPCPWCNEPPQIVESTNPDYKPPGDWTFKFDAPQGVRIECVNRMCPIRPHTATALRGNIDMFYWNWNARAALTADRPERGGDELLGPDVVDFVVQYGPRCRDCADEDGVCPINSIPCGDKRKIVEYVINAINYGVKNNFLPEPTTSEVMPGLQEAIERAEYTTTEYTAAILVKGKPHPEGMNFEDISILIQAARAHAKQAGGGDRKDILLLTAMGFKHKIENGFHVVEGHGFKYSHIGILNIGHRIKDWLASRPKSAGGDDGK